MTDVAHGPGSTGVSAFSLVRFEREIFPFLKCSQWVPARGSDERDRVAGAYDVVFPRGLLERMRHLAKQFPEGDFVGLIYGKACECSWTRRHWLRVDDVVTETPPRRGGLLRRRPSEVDHLPIGERLERLISGADDSQGTLLGWFRIRHTEALVLFASESETHAELFREPWQFAVLLPTPGSEGNYGVFGRDEDGRIRDSLARPFYEHEDGWKGRRGRAATPPNYRQIERAQKLPGSSGAWREVKRRKAPAMATAACTIFGVAGGLALSYELSRASQPGGFLADGASFASPLDGGVGALATPVESQLTVFERYVETFNAMLDEPVADGYCEELRSAHLAVHGSFVTLIREREELDEESAAEGIEMAIQAKARADNRFERSGCD